MMHVAELVLMVEDLTVRNLNKVFSLQKRTIQIIHNMIISTHIFSLWYGSQLQMEISCSTYIS